MILFKHKETGRYLVDFTRKDKKPITTKVVADAKKFENDKGYFKRYVEHNNEYLREFEIVNK